MEKLTGRILILDDDQDVLYTARLILKQRFQVVKTEGNPEAFLDTLQREPFDVILLDMNFSRGATDGREGMYWLKEILVINPDAHVIVNTAYGDIQLAVDAMKEGAVDFLVKPWEKEKLLATVQSIFNLSISKKEVQRLKNRERALNTDLESLFPEVVSHSVKMQSVLKTVEKVASTDANVLLLGENGTGKEVIARMIHRHSLRASGPFIKVDLGALSENLFESELFGHARGAFTDAKEGREGRFEIASGGTLFLDEIGNLSLPLQAKLLTAIQSKEIVRVGTNKPVPTDIRLICATNISLPDSVNKGDFRQDLLYRINTVEIDLPPLRSRPEDIPALAEYYLKMYTRKYNKQGLVISSDALEKLQDYHWPGNIRELQHTLERAVIMCGSSTLDAADFILNTSKSPAEIKPAFVKEEKTFNIEELEKSAIQNAIRKHEGNLSKAADELGLGRTTLYRKMAKYGL